MPRGRRATDDSPLAQPVATGAAKTGRRNGVAKSHDEKCRDHVGHGRAVQRDRRVVCTRVTKRRWERTADEYVPGTEKHRRKKAAKATR